MNHFCECKIENKVVLKSPMNGYLCSILKWLYDDVHYCQINDYATTHSPQSFRFFQPENSPLFVSFHTFSRFLNCSILLLNNPSRTETTKNQSHFRIISFNSPKKSHLAVLKPINRTGNGLANGAPRIMLPL